MRNHNNAHERKKKGLPIHVGIYDTTTGEYVATAYSVHFAARIVHALNDCEKSQHGPLTPASGM